MASKRRNMLYKNKKQETTEIEDNFLEAFIWGTKTMVMAQKKVDNYFWCRSTMDQLFRDRDPGHPDVFRYNRTVLQYFLPRPTPDGCRVMMFQPTESCGPDNFDYVHFSRVTNMLLDLALACGSMSRIRGSILLFDAKHLTSRLALLLYPTILAMNIEYFQNATPVIFKKIVLFNMHPIAEKLFNNVLKPLLSNKLVQRVSITRGDHACVRELIPEEMLPKDYGGTELSSRQLQEKWLELLVEWRPWFVGLPGTRRSDEKLRTTDQEIPDGECVYGTFRNLIID